MSGPIYKHIKRGSTYEVLTMEGKVQSARPIIEGEPVVVYRAVSDNTIWVRPASEFNDGCFEEIKK